jgi:hypothetical protein
MPERTWRPIGIDRDGRRCTVYFARPAEDGRWEFTHEEIHPYADGERVQPGNPTPAE